MRTAFIMLIVCLAGPAFAQDGPPLDLAELDNQRGGFLTPTGLEVSFGAVVSTYVDGNLALQTQFTLTDQGLEQTTTAGLPGNVTDAATGAGINLGGLGGEGVYVPGDNGGTVVLHGLDASHLTGMILNTADNRDIRQQVDMTVGIEALDQLQSQIVGQQMDLRLNDAIGRAIQDATR